MTIDWRGDTVLAYVKGRGGGHRPVQSGDGEGGPGPLDVQALNDAVEQLSGEGYRVGCCEARAGGNPGAAVANDPGTELTFLALVALIDPPRPEVPPGSGRLCCRGDHTGDDYRRPSRNSGGNCAAPRDLR